MLSLIEIHLKLYDHEYVYDLQVINFKQVLQKKHEAKLYVKVARSFVNLTKNFKVYSFICDILKAARLLL